MDNTNVHNWDTECWKCGEDTQVVWPQNDPLDSDVGEELAEQSEYNVQRVFSKTRDKEVCGNVCSSCDAYQGNHYIRQEAIEKFAPPIECPKCGDDHEWYPDEGMGGAFGQGWINCPEYGPITKGEPEF